MQEVFMAEKVRDLRSALALLERMPDQLIETDVEVDPMAELAGVYRYVGAGGTVKRPTKEGPAMIFNHVKGKELLLYLIPSRKILERCFVKVWRILFHR